MSLYYAYIQTYVNYANLAWTSTIITNLKKIHSHQKHAICIVFRKDKFSHTKELFVQNKVFKVYQLNILNNFIFMHKGWNCTSSISTKISKSNTSIPCKFFETKLYKTKVLIKQIKMQNVCKRSSPLERVFNKHWKGNEKSIVFWK